MAPGKVWLTLIPLFGQVWQFVVVLNIAKSLKNEFARVGIPCPDPDAAQAVGLGMCACNCCVLIPIPLLKDLLGIVGFVLWIAYWFRIANFTRALDARQAAAPASPIS